jgi:hypothetical protein
MSGTERRQRLDRRGGDPMNAIDRVMRAYSRKHTLTDEQTVRVHLELSTFIEELMLGKGLKLHHELRYFPRN